MGYYIIQLIVNVDIEETPVNISLLNSALVTTLTKISPLDVGLILYVPSLDTFSCVHEFDVGLLQKTVQFILSN